MAGRGRRKRSWSEMPEGRKMEVVTPER